MNRLLSLLIVFVGFSASGQNYIPDTTFGANGVVTNPYLSFYKTPSNIFFINNSYYFLDYNTMYHFDYSGNVDMSFGTNGASAIPSLPATTIVNAKAEGGFFYLYGYNEYNGVKDIVIIKININGIYDSSFGVNGIAQIDFGSFEEATDILVNPDGSIYVLGSKSVIGIGDTVIVSLINSNGTVNTTFDPTGYKTYDIPIPNSSRKSGNIFSYNGNLLITGIYRFNDGNCIHYEIFIRELTTSGAIVNSYGVNGFKSIFLDCYQSHSLQDAYLIGNDLYVSLYYGGSFNDQGYKLLKYDLTTDQKMFYVGMTRYRPFFSVDANGKVLMTDPYACNSTPCNTDFKIWQLNADGTTDTSFSNGSGFYTYGFQYPGVSTNINDNAFSLYKDSNGKILIAGSSTDGNTGQTNVGLVRIVEGTLSTDNPAVNEVFKILPNPTHNVITIQTSSNFIIDKIEINDISGKKVMEQDGNGNSYSVEQLQNGLYFLTVHSNKTIYTLKFIKS